MSAKPGTSQRRPSFEQRDVSALSWLVLLGGILTIALAAHMVLVCYSRLPFADGWTQIFLAVSGESPFSLRWLWQQHNEHRLLIPKLLLGLDLRLFGARQQFLLASIFAIQLLHWCLLSWSMRALGGWRGPLSRTGTGLAAFCLFCPTQWENLTWGFQSCFVLPPLFATFSFVGLLLYRRKFQAPQSLGGLKWIVLSVLAALAAECCLANGLLLLPLLALAALMLHMRRVVVLTYVSAAAVSTALYFHDYIPPTQNSDPFVTLRSPTKLLSYVATYFGSSWTVGSSWTHHNLLVAPLIGAVGFAIFVAFLLIFRRSKAQQTAFLAQLILTALFCLGTAFLTALGRAASGNEQAFASRYQTIALLFWWCLGSLTLTRAATGRRVLLVAIQFLFAVVLLRGAVLAHLPVREAREHAFQQHATSAALLTGVNDREQIARVFPDPNYVLALLPVMREKQLSIFSERTALGRPITAVARIADPDECEGELESTTELKDGDSQARIVGWAWDLKSRKPVTQMLTVANGDVVGLGAVGDWRPMVRAFHHNISTSFIGFTAYAKSMSPAPVTVYAVLPGDAQKVCQVEVIQP